MDYTSCSKIVSMSNKESLLYMWDLETKCKHLLAEAAVALGETVENFCWSGLGWVHLDKLSARRGEVQFGNTKTGVLGPICSP